MAGRIRSAGHELGQLFDMASNLRERASITKFVLLLYVARAMPVDTYGWNTTVHLHDRNYRIGVRTSEIYVFDEVYGERMYDRLEEYSTRAGWVVVDVGANVGVFTALAAGRGAEVHAFEPNRGCFDRLSWTVHANDLAERVHLFNLAVGEQDGSATLKVTRGGTTGGTVVTTAEPSVAGVQVEMSTLDSWAGRQGITRLDLLKIDVEGAEGDVLRGAESILPATARVIAEYHSLDLLRELDEILTSHGFVRDLRFVYCEEDPDAGVDEVGYGYWSRPDETPSAGG